MKSHRYMFNRWKDQGRHFRTGVLQRQKSLNYTLAVVLSVTAKNPNATTHLKKYVTLLDLFSIRLNQVDWILNKTFEWLFAVSVKFLPVRYSVTSSTICHYICPNKLQYFKAWKNAKTSWPTPARQRKYSNRVIQTVHNVHINRVRKAGLMI